MFIKIKLELQSLEEKISYFSIDDDATIINLKLKIEGYVGVPPEHQEIRTLEKVFKNNECVRDVCDIRGSTIMLYAYDEDYKFGDPRFVCFLQVYSNEMAAEEQILAKRSKLPIENSKTSGSISSIRLVVSSDTDSDSEETDSETSSTSNLDCDCSTDSTESLLRKKPIEHEKNYILGNKKLRVTASSKTQLPDSLYQTLNEYVNICRDVISSEDKTPEINKNISHKTPTDNIVANDSLVPCKSEVGGLNENDLILMENRKILFDETANNSLSKIQSNNIATTVSKNKENRIHPCQLISPEIRDYLAIIIPNDETAISKDEFEKLLVWFFDRFYANELSNDLQFDNRTAISLFDGKLWIACKNSKTFDWVSISIAQYPIKPYKILSLNDSKHKCEVVIPIISDTKNVLDVFNLLEKQNKNITTLKWSVETRQTLSPEGKDFNEKAVTRFCNNELFNICMDTESKDNLENLGYKLKFCFWQIVFKFI